jgi:hypothetical protein
LGYALDILRHAGNCLYIQQVEFQKLHPPIGSTVFKQLNSTKGNHRQQRPEPTTIELKIYPLFASKVLSNNPVKAMSGSSELAPMSERRSEQCGLAWLFWQA